MTAKTDEPVTRRKRAGSSLGGHPRGDTGVASLTTIGTISQQTQPPRRSSWLQWVIRNTWVPPLALMLAVLAAYAVNPSEENPLHPAIFLSYANPPLVERTNTLPAELGNPTQYGKGKKDFAFVAFYTVFFTFTREFLMQRIIRPIAVWYGIRSPGKQARFMEQFYTAIYFAVFGPFGLFVMSRTPVWYFNTAGMYADFPHRAHEAVFKAYYLLQAAYWAQQAIVLVLMLEKPRKDFKELVLHHVVTLSLIFLSYRFHFTYMGIAVYITHDISDFFLASVKVLNYINSPFTPPYYVFFIGVWAYMRHFLNLRILVSMLPGHEFETVGRYDLSWPEQQYKCWLSQYITSALLVILQAVNIFWFFLILRILYRILTRGERKDERSDDEEDEPVQAEQAPPPPPQITINGTTQTVASSTGIDEAPASSGRVLRQR